MSSVEQKGKVIDVLNQAISMELFAIHQYMNQHYNLDAWDYGEFAANIKRIAIDEMDHAERLSERVKELGGEPSNDLADKLQKGQKVEEVFTFNTNLEDDTIAKYNQFVKVCRDNNDAISANLFVDLLDQEQAHFNYFEVTVEHLKNLGNAYLAKIAGTDSDIGETTLGFVVKGDD